MPELRQRAGAAALSLLSGVACRLPVGLLHRAAHAVGGGWYLVAPGDRELARANLGRVCRWLDENGTASPRVRAAARDARALERLVRQAFGHRARYYLEVAMAGRYDQAHLERHVTLDDPELVDRLITAPGALLVVGLHFGALELPALYLTAVHGIRVVAPMETLANRHLQAWMERSRAHSGVLIIPTRGARAELERALRRGDTVGLVADRDVAGSGLPTGLFGAPTRLPAGPGIFTADRAVRGFVAGARRTGWGDYRVAVVPLEPPSGGSARERALESTERIARAFERIIAAAPEQWWSIFMPLWEDAAADASAPHPAPVGGPR
jgi:lauroyl/myristoyl acyltransferase